MSSISSHNIFTTLFHFSVCARMCVVLWESRCAHFGAGMEIREQLQELLLSYLLGPRDETQVSRLSASPTESSEKLVFSSYSVCANSYESFH